MNGDYIDLHRNFAYLEGKHRKVYHSRSPSIPTSSPNTGNMVALRRTRIDSAIDSGRETTKGSEQRCDRVRYIEVREK